MNVLIANPAEIVREEGTHPDLQPSLRYSDGSQDWYLYLCSVDVTDQYPGSKLIGIWNADGSVYAPGDPPVPTPIDPDYLDYIRPFGNAAGVATDSLDYHHWLGGGQRQVQADPVAQTLAEYPDDRQPIVLTMERRFDDTAGFEGEGWICTIEFADPNRPPNARAIGIYDEDFNFIYTTGAFVFTDQGDGTFKWQTENPAGRVTPTPEPIYYALLLGSAQEGRMSLFADDQERTDFFWEFDQGEPSNGSWIDSGATVTGMAGTATLVSDTTPFSNGQEVRIDGFEMTVTSISPGQWLVLNPYRVSPTGASIEIRG